LKWVLSFPDILVLAGVEEKKYIDQNWKAFTGSYDLTDDEKNDVKRISKEYENNFCRRCDYCMPCPSDIVIQYILGVKSFVKRMGYATIKKPPFSKMFENAAKCNECGDCMKRCPYELPITDMIKANLKWLKEFEQ
jgi:uncharacterized protein